MPLPDLVDAPWRRGEKLVVVDPLHPEDRIAIAFGGGGSLGSFEVGVAKALLGDLKLKPAILTGTSTGALVAAKLAEGPGAVGQLEASWREITGYEDVYTMEPWFAGLQHAAQWVMHQSLQDLARGLFLDPLAVGSRLLAVADEAKRALDGARRARSLYATAPLKASVYNRIRNPTVASSGIQLRVATTVLESGQTIYATERGDLLGAHGEALGRSVDLHEALLASAAIPVFFPPVALGDAATPLTCVDGGVREMVPARMAARLGATRIFIVLSSPPIQLKGSFAAATIPDIASRMLDAMLDEITLDDQALGGGGKLRTRVVPVPLYPRIPLHDALTFDPGLISIAIDYGQMLATDAFLPDRALAAQAAADADAITRARYAAWDLEYRANCMDSEQDVVVKPVVPGPPSGLVLTPDRDTFDSLRAEKRKVRDALRHRGALGVKMPPDGDRLWKGWERHSFRPVYATPWDRIPTPSSSGDIPAADPNG